MGKITYASLKLKPDTSVKTFDFENNTIEVLKYLPVEDKIDLVDITLQKSLENGIYNPIKIDMHFHLGLVYLYTNLSFTDKQKENESKIYDTLKSNGFIYKLLDCIEESEYNELYEFISDAIKNNYKYRNSTASVLSKVIDDLPGNAETAMKLVESFDRAKYQDVIDFARAANGGRPIQ